MKTGKWIILTLLALLVIYLSSYLCLSLGGRYEPAGIGLNGVKSYNWAPRGFVTDYRWNRAPEAFYLPLYAVDILFWHTIDAADSGHYPVNRVDRKDIWKVYKANGF
jgi:hypothetical protein